MTIERRPVHRVALTVVDILAVLLLLVFVAVAIHGGFVVRWSGLRLSFRSAWRPLAWAVGLIVVRHVLVPRPALHERLIALAHRITRLQGQLPTDDVFSPRVVTPRDRPQWARAALWTIGIVSLYWVLTFVMTYPQVRVLDRGVSLDIGDPLLSTWRLSWVAHQLPRDPLHLFDANIFYPTKSTLAFSDAMLVPSLTAAPFVWLGVHKVLVYNLVLLSGFALSGAAMFLLVRSLTRDTAAAVLAGFVFAFLPYRFMHYAHLELQMTQWMPLCLWALHRTITGGRLRDGLLTGLFLALQTLSSLYYGIFFVTYLVPVGAALLLGTPGAPTWRSLRALAAGAVLAAIVVGPVTKPYFDARKSVGERRISEVDFYSATPQNYLAAHQRNAMYGKLTEGLGSQERELFQGLAVPLIAVAGLWPPVSAARIGYAVALGVAFEVSLGTNGLVFPWLRDYALPYRGLRVPARMAILVGLSLAILVGYGVARLWRRWRQPWARYATLAVLTALIVTEYRSNLVLKDVWLQPAPVYDALAAKPDAVLLELPLVIPDVALEPIYMYFSTWHWHPLVNGYSGFSPPSYHKLLETMATFPDDASVADIRQRGVDYLIVHGAFYRPGDYQTLVARLASRPELVLEGVTRWEARETRLYRVVK